MKLFITLTILLTSVIAKGSFVITPTLIEAQKFIAELRLDKGQALIDAERKANPGNFAVDYIENSIDIFRLLVIQDERDYERLHKNKEKRIARLKLIEKSSPYHLHAQAEIMLQWAFVDGWFEEYLAAAWDFKTSYKLINENIEKFPDFALNSKDINTLKTFLGLVPDGYKWILTMSGMEGNFNEGMKGIKTYLENPSLSKDFILERYNAIYVYTLLYMNYVKDKPGAWKLCCQYISDYETNLLSCDVRAFIAMNTDNNDEAIRTLLNRPVSPEYIRFVFMDYILGKAKLNRLELDAEVYLKKFNAFTRDLTMTEESYMRLAWCAWLKSDTAAFQLYMKIARTHAPEQSKKSIPSASQGDVNRFPETNLLKARLLFDGGYYTQAEEILKKQLLNSLKTPNEKAEYCYLFARVYHENNQILKAIDFYNKAIIESKPINSYYAPISCLQLGYIYEKLNYTQLARSYYKKVLDYGNYLNKNTIQQRARAALSKME